MAAPAHDPVGLTRAWFAACLVALATLCAGRAAAVPSFAVQTGQPCQACHVGGLGPQLTPFGREFKLHGFTARTVAFNLPIAAFATVSYLRTQKDQASPPADGFRVNDNVAIDQVSLFLAGGLGKHLGAFVQTTYDGVGKAFSWDNLDIRAVTKARAGGTDMVLGLGVNNNPTVQDPFNTLPAWGFPYTDSALSPAPDASPMIGNLGETTLGATAYAWIDGKVYIEAGAYKSLGAGVLGRLGADPFSPGKIDGAAPYARVAYVKNLGDRNIEVGAFALDAKLFPGRDETTGRSDRYTDVGFDASYQYFAANRDVFTVNARYIHERRRLAASQALGLARFERGDLQDFRIDASYYWRNKIGASAQVFQTRGSRDDLLYGGHRTFAPDSSGLNLQLDATPYGDGRSPLGPRFNLRVGVQYTAYFKFNGAGTDYDGQGHAASDNNTLRVFSWIYY